MKESEAIEKLRAYHKCQRLQVKGIYEDCNEKLCDNCDLCYAQGNTGEHIESVEVAINSLEKQKKIKEAVANANKWSKEDILVKAQAFCEIEKILRSDEE